MFVIPIIVFYFNQSSHHCLCLIYFWLSDAHLILSYFLHIFLCFPYILNLKYFWNYFFMVLNTLYPLNLLCQRINFDYVTSKVSVENIVLYFKCYRTLCFNGNHWVWPNLWLFSSCLNILTNYYKIFEILLHKTP